MQWFQKKDTGTYTAPGAALGGRTLKTGQSRWFVGYKKHTLRLWLPTARAAVTLVPLVSWVAPANFSEGGLLIPSLHLCERRLGWWPGIVVADMGYLAAASKQAARQRWQTAVVTKLRTDMKLLPPYATPERVECSHGQRLDWWEYDPQIDAQWFHVREGSPLCNVCWEQTTCPRHFAFPAGQHETLFGLLPLACAPVQRLLQQVRPWIERLNPSRRTNWGSVRCSSIAFDSPGRCVFGPIARSCFA